MNTNHLLPLIQSGDKKAFEEAYTCYNTALFNYLYAKTKNETIVAEVVQLTFIKLWKYRAHLNNALSLSTQIFQFAKTSLIDELRKEERRLRLNQAWAGVVNFADNFEIIFEKAELTEVQLKIRNAIATLPPVRKKVFELSRFEEMSYKEISLQLDMSERTVGKHIQLAIKQLKKAIQLFVIFAINFLFI